MRFLNLNLESPTPPLAEMFNTAPLKIDKKPKITPITSQMGKRSIALTI